MPKGLKAFGWRVYGVVLIVVLVVFALWMLNGVLSHRPACNSYANIIQAEQAAAAGACKPSQ